MALAPPTRQHEVEPPPESRGSAGWRALDHPAPRRSRFDAGRDRRSALPLADHADVELPPDRDPVAVLGTQDAGRVQALVPIRYGRMSTDPLAFYRGAAAVMAADLAAGPRTDLHVQLCGDAHLSNFGVFAAPDRRLVVDVNDFDETMTGPFEWDVKRLAASLVVTGRVIGCSAAQTERATLAALAEYRAVMGWAADADPLALWFQRVELGDVSVAMAKSRKRADRRLAQVERRASKRDRIGALAKLTDIVDGRRVIVSRPPLITRFDEEALAEQLPRILEFFDGYLRSLPPDRRMVLGRYGLVDLAHKVVGVGSVGTRCLVALFESGDGEPLFLQLKEATTSVLEPHLGPSGFDHPGQRVVEGQRMVQAASDVFLGWSRFHGPNGDVDFYVRQLWDGKYSAPVERLGPGPLRRYAALCGAVLARAHARSGDGAMIAGYLGGSDAFDRAVLAYAWTYADRTATDHQLLVDAIDQGAVTAHRDR
jgi:uncharacterized protein (DUF2252 family)